MNITHLQEKIVEREEHIEELQSTNTLHPEVLKDCINYHRDLINKDETKIREYLELCVNGKD